MNFSWQKYFHKFFKTWNCKMTWHTTSFPISFHIIKKSWDQGLLGHNILIAMEMNIIFIMKIILTLLLGSFWLPNILLFPTNMEFTIAANRQTNIREINRREAMSLLLFTLLQVVNTPFEDLWIFDLENVPLCCRQVYCTSNEFVYKVCTILYVQTVLLSTGV